MTEENILLKEAQEQYFKEGAQLEAIRLYKKLLEKYPDNIQGWSGLATMQYDIQDFDQAIKSSHKMLSLDPENARNTEMFLTKLQLLQKFTFAAPNMYVDEKTREAYEITELTGAFSLFEQIEKYSYRLLDLYKENLKKVYEINFSLALTLIGQGKFQDALTCLRRSLELKEYAVSRFSNPAALIYNWMSAAYLGMKDYTTALHYIELAFENGLDAYNYLKKASIYKESGDIAMHDKAIEDFIVIVDAKIKTQPETAFILQKINALLQMNAIERAEKALSDFDLLKPHHDQLLKTIEEQKKRIHTKKTSA